jgi:hypothetical protein
MISPWNNLNLQGRVLVCACVINLSVAILLAVEGKMMCLFSAAMAVFCGLMSFCDKYQTIDHLKINKKDKDE